MSIRTDYPLRVYQITGGANVDLPTVSAAVQAVSAVAIVCLTVWLSKTARTALKTSQVQAQAADKTVAEMRKDGHLASVPMLAITPQPLVSPERNRILGALRFANASSTPALNVRVRLSEALGLGFPRLTMIEENAGAITVIAPGANDVEMPLDFSKFSQAEAPNLQRPWVIIEVTYRGLLGAQVIQKWYWEPLDWNPEPTHNLGEKLVLFEMIGSSGAEGEIRDIELSLGTLVWPSFLEWPAGMSQPPMLNPSGVPWLRRLARRKPPTR